MHKKVDLASDDYLEITADAIPYSTCIKISSTLPAVKELVAFFAASGFDAEPIHTTINGTANLPAFAYVDCCMSLETFCKQVEIFCQSNGYLCLAPVKSIDDINITITNLSAKDL